MKVNLKKSAIAPLVFMAVACGSGTDHKSDTPQDAPQEPKTEEITTDERDVSIVFPSAVEIMTVFENAGLDFEKDLTLDPALASNFNTQFQKSIATGIYTSDLAYCVINDQPQEAVEYMKAVLDMSSKLGIEAIEDVQGTIKTFEDAIGDRTKTLDVLENTQKQTDAYVLDNDMQPLAVVIFSGAWLEGVYLAIETNDEWRKKELSNKMIDQMYILENLLRSLSKSEMSSENYKAYYEDLNQLNITFNDMLNSLPEDGELSLKQLQTLADMVVGIRQEHFLPH